MDMIIFGELTHIERVHHPIYNIEPRKFNLKMLAYYKLDEIYATIGEAEGGIKSICKCT